MKMELGGANWVQIFIRSKFPSDAQRIDAPFNSDRYLYKPELTRLDIAVLSMIKSKAIFRFGLDLLVIRV